MKTKSKQALEFAHARAKSAKNWIELHNALFGIGGKIGELFGTESERTAFGSSLEYRDIQKLIDSLRTRSGDGELGDLAANANGKLLVRMPRSLHAALLAEAAAEGVSVNQLVVSKLSMQLGAVVRK